jgi:hypothetical protein
MSLQMSKGRQYKKEDCFHLVFWGFSRRRAMRSVAFFWAIAICDTSPCTSTRLLAGLCVDKEHQVGRTRAGGEVWKKARPSFDQPEGTPVFISYT